ncbi:MAG TPA: UDP-N-acetylmuramoyl-L-alanine--D-glutamate ligase [Rickettsiales bacterium]|nr:UDP-N-acetylmuramoyl-L-alanine--D-glutamate ligase [Rickettsiales bacterium]
MKISNLKNKNIAIWGSGIEGKSILKVLQKKFPEKEIPILDDKNYTDSQKLIDDLKGIDIVIRSPGVSIYKPEIIYAKEHFGTQFITEKTIFFSELKDSKAITIGITGTKGKTTTATFFAYILEKLGYNVMLTGNMGIPTIELIEEAKKKDFVVIELSSYQNSDLLEFPKIAILLNLFPEHIQWHQTHEQYYKDKCNLLKSVETSIINGTDKRVALYTKSIKNKIEFNTQSTIHYNNSFFYDGEKKLLSSKNMKLLGEHNYQNLCSILTTLKHLNIDLSKIKQDDFDNFQPVEHRLEIIKKNNTIFVNDSISTTPETTIACFNVFKDKNIYGILGGFDREQDYSELAKYISENKNIKYISLLGQTGKRIAEELEKLNIHYFNICKSLEECIDLLIDKSKNEKDIVITLSPGAPSYDMFKNFEERGNKFKEYLKI